MNIVSISCKQAAYLNSKASFNSLTALERVKLKLHLKLCTCPTCHDFPKDSELIEEALDKVMQQREKQELQLSDEQRAKILDKLKS